MYAAHHNVMMAQNPNKIMAMEYVHFEPLMLVSIADKVRKLRNSLEVGFPVSRQLRRTEVQYKAGATH